MRKPKPIPEEFVDIGEASRILNVHETTIQAHITSGRFSIHRREIEKWRPLLKRSEVLAYLDERQRRPRSVSVTSLRFMAKEARMAVLNRDHGQCVVCRYKPARESNRIVHHVIPRRGTDAVYDDHSVDNNVTLCPSCHVTLHGAILARQKLTIRGETAGTMEMVERLLMGLNL